MLKLLTCAQGHFWEAEAPEDGAPAPLCPVCGAAADALPLLDLVSTEPAAPPTPQPVAFPPGPPPLTDDSGRPVVAGYDLLADLGRGPTGVRCFRARQHIVNRTVRLKVVLARDDPGQVAWGSLRAEANALARMTHPHVVQLLDVGERDRLLFYNAVEDVEGPTLGQFLDGKPLPWRQAAALVEALARAVHHAHQHGAVHRCLRPACVLLRPEEKGDAKKERPEGRAPYLALRGGGWLPKLTDFGLARKPVEGDLIDLDLQRGQPAYLAPEQAWGRAKEVGAGCDVYALGAILHECLTGVPPFRGDTPGLVVEKIQTREPPPPSQLAPRVPRDLDAVVRRCMQRQPRRRYASARDAADDLRRLLDGRPVAARRAGGAERFGRWLGRNWLAAAAVLLLLLCGGLILAMTFGGGLSKTEKARLEWAEDQKREALGRVWEAEQGRERAEKIVETLHYANTLALVDREQSHGRGAAELLDGCPEELRHWEWQFLKARARGAAAPLVLKMAVSPISSLAFEPRGPLLAASAVGPDAFAAPRGQAAVWDVRTGNPVPVWTDQDKPIYQVAFDPNEERLVRVGGAGAGGDLRDWNWRMGSELVALKFDGPRPLTSVVVSPNNRRLIAADQSGRLRVLDGRRETLLTPEGLDWRDANNPDPVRLALLDHQGVGVAVSMPQRRQVFLYRNLPADEGVCAPDSVLAGHADAVLDLACHPNRGLLATASRDRTVKVWDPSAARELRTLRGHSAAVTAVAFSPDGKRLFSGGEDGAVRVWDATSGLLLLSLEAPSDAGPVRLAVPSHSQAAPGQLLLAVGRGKQIHVWGPFLP
jgi:hypothetical protein